MPDRAQIVADVLARPSASRASTRAPTHAGRAGRLRARELSVDDLRRERAELARQLQQPPLRWRPERRHRERGAGSSRRARGPLRLRAPTCCATGSRYAAADRLAGAESHLTALARTANYVRGLPAPLDPPRDARPLPGVPKRHCPLSSRSTKRRRRQSARSRSANSIRWESPEISATTSATPAKATMNSSLGRPSVVGMAAQRARSGRPGHQQSPHATRQAGQRWRVRKPVH